MEGVKVSVDIKFLDVAEILRDGIIVSKVGMEHPGGEVLTLAPSADGVEMVIEWTDFATRRSITRSYRIRCGKQEVEPL